MTQRKSTALFAACRHQARKPDRHPRGLCTEVWLQDFC